MATCVQILQVDLGQPPSWSRASDRTLPHTDAPGPSRIRVARATARDVLGRTLGVGAGRGADLRAVQTLGHPTHGRPTFPGGQASFSLSHSGDRALFAVTADDVAVGVDIEVVRDRVHLARLAARVLDADQLARWSALPIPTASVRSCARGR